MTCRSQTCARITDANPFAREHLAPDPIAQFERWFQAAAACKEITEPNAMTLATSDLQGEVSARIVLLKGIDAAGFRFFTNYESYKGTPTHRQPAGRIVVFLACSGAADKNSRGTIEKLSRAEADAYFQSRPRGNQLGASVSAQSSVVANREELEKRSDGSWKKNTRGSPFRCRHSGVGIFCAPQFLNSGRGGKIACMIVFPFVMEKDSWIIERLAP